MVDETAVQASYTTVQLRKDLHKRICFLKLERDTDVRTEIENAVVQYLQAQAGNAQQGEQPAASA